MTSFTEQAGRAISVDWSIVLAALSLWVSFATLYIAYLRGPKIELVIPSNPYPTRALQADDNEVTLGIELLVVNVGNRPGLLYDVTIASDKNSPVQEHVFGNQKSKGVPLLLAPGGEWRRMYYVTLSYWCSPEQLQYLRSHSTARLRVKYLHSTTFQSKYTAKRDVRIRMDDFRRVDPEAFDKKTHLTR